MTTTDDLTAAIQALSEREASLVAHLLGGMAFAAEEEGHRRLSAVWRAMGLAVFEEMERQGEVLAELDEGDGAPG